MAGNYGIVALHRGRLRRQLWIAAIFSAAIHGLALEAFVSYNPPSSDLPQDFEPITLTLPTNAKWETKNLGKSLAKAIETKKREMAPRAVRPTNQTTQPALENHLSSVLDSRAFSPEVVDEKAMVSQLRFPEESPAFWVEEISFRARVTIGSDGNPETFEYLDFVKISPELASVIKETVLSAKYKPAYIRGRPVKSWVILQLQLTE